MSSIPIIFVHTGNNYYLHFSINQAHASNPGNPIYLITDSLAPQYDFVEYVDISRYKKSAEAFKQQYVHMSTNNAAHELFCFQRWFIIRDFCTEKKIDGFLYLDSDLMLYADIDAYFPALQNIDFTISKKLGPQCCYFPSLQKLETFCAYIGKLYSEPSLYKRLQAKHEHHLANTLDGGVCDMTAFYEYQRDFPQAAKDLSIAESNVVFDDNINEADGYLFNHVEKIKEISMRNGKAFGRRAAGGGEVEFKSLHFQGGAKKYMYRYYTGKSLGGHKRKLAFDLFLMKHLFLYKALRKLGYTATRF